MAKVRIRCSNCPASSEVEESLLGKTVRCKRCETRFVLSRAEDSVGASSKAADGHEAGDGAGAEDGVALIWQPGDVILDLYEVKQVHEGGGMGLVYRVHHRGWNTDLAVKCPRPDYFRTERQRENFEREAETWVNLGLHSHTVSCYYVRRLGGVPRLFAEYVAGGSLKDWIRDGRLYEGGPEAALERILDIAIQFAWGLHYAHERGLVHQDVKPANVLMTPEGIAKVSDFGLSRARERAMDGADAAAGASFLVSSGAGLLTLAYCSPEQAEGRPLSRKTDVWSWAVSVLEMFVGEVTWSSGAVAGEALEAYLVAGAGDPRLPAMPLGVAGVLRRCLRRDPEARPKDMILIAASLCEDYQQVSGRGDPREEPKPVETLAGGLNNHAISMLDLGKQEEAERLWDEALRADPQHMESVYNRGLVRWRSGRMTDDMLLRELREAGSAADAERSGRLLAWVHMERGDCESALPELEGMDRVGLADSSVQAEIELVRRLLARSTRRLGTLEGHTEGISSVALSSDGRTAISGSWDRTVRMWDLTSGRCLRTLKVGGNGSHSTEVALSGDGRIAVSGGDDLKVRVWDVASGLCLRTLEGHTSEIGSVALTSDGRTAISADGHRTVRVWDLTNGRCLRTLEGHTQSVRSVALSSDGRTAISASWDCTVWVWDLTNGRCLRTLEGHTQSVRSVALSSDGRTAISASWDCTVWVWDLTNGRCLRTLEGHIQSVNSVALSPDGRTAVSGGEDRTVRVWDVASGRCLRTLEGHTSVINSVALSSNGRIAISADRDGAVQVWTLGAARTAVKCSYELCTPATIATVMKRAAMYRIGLEDARHALAVGDNSGAAVHLRRARAIPGYRRRKEIVELWGRLYPRMCHGAFAGAWEEFRLEGHTRPVRCVSVSSDGRTAFSGDRGGTVRVWDLTSGDCLGSFERSECKPGILPPPVDSSVNSVVLSSDGRIKIAPGCVLWVRIGSSFFGKTGCPAGHCLNPDGRGTVPIDSVEKTLRVWDATSGHRLHTLKGHTRKVTSVALSPDGRTAVSGGEDRTVRVWDVASGRCLRTLEGHAREVTSVALSLDGRSVVSGGDDNLVRVWDVASGGGTRTLQGHTRKVTSVALSPDGRTAVSGGEDRTVRVWDVASGHCLRTLEGHTQSVNSVALSPDGRTAVSGGDDRTVRVWVLDRELDDRPPTDWDEGARPSLEMFLSEHTPFAAPLPSRRAPGKLAMFLSQHTPFGDPLPSGRAPRKAEVVLALTRRGGPEWTEDDFGRLLFTLGCVGYGWLRPTGVRRELEKMAAAWQGPPPLLGK